MVLQRYDQNSLLHRFQNEINQMFERDRTDTASGELAATSTAEWLPAVDIEETQDGYTIAADIPGMKPEDVEITFENGVLTVQGERKTEHSADDNRTRRVERTFGRFMRRFSLPDAADADDIDARVQDGVLNLTIKKRAETKPRKIEVQG